MSAPTGSEGATPAQAGSVPERANQEQAPLESENGQRLAERACSAISVSIQIDDDGVEYIMHPFTGKRINCSEIPRGQSIQFRSMDQRKGAKTSTPDPSDNSRKT